MKRLIVLLIVLALSVAIGIKIAHDPGYIVLAYSVWTVEMPLWLAVLGIVLVMIALTLIYRLLMGCLRLPKRYHAWRERHLEKRAWLDTERGIIALSEGHWKKAQRYLLRGSKHNSSSVINYLGAATAAQRQSQSQIRDDYLRIAHEKAEHADVAISLTQARFQFEQGQFEQSLATLRRLQSMMPRHEQVLMLLKDVYLALEDWPQLLLHLDILKKNRLITPEDYQQLSEQAFIGSFDKLPDDLSLQQLEEVWDALPRAMRKTPNVLCAFLPRLLQQEGDARAEVLIYDMLTHAWDDRLISYYGLVQGSNPKKQLHRAQGWLKHNPQHAPLLLALGRICLHQQLWGKAYTYLQDSITISPSPDAYFELGRLFLKDNLNEKAQRAFAEGLALVTARKQTRLPALAGSAVASYKALE